MERRKFLGLSMAGLVVPQWVQAKKNQTSVISDIYYTKESTGRWSGKVATHLPTLEIEKQVGKVIVHVVTAHEMKGYEHYIVKHVLLDKDYKFLDEHLFNPEKDKAAISTFVLDQPYRGKLHALSLCNKHDLWLNAIVI